ncbi:MAG: ATP-binding cassette domain-containing protein [Proteobacteria bacterium]|nr:ATP-binding cassette domain-containing protein [Pseudomonadota bacterium]
MRNILTAVFLLFNEIRFYIESMTNAPTNSENQGQGTPLVSFRRVSRFYKPDKASLFDVTFDIFSGEFMYIAGTSGAGKSTLLRLLHATEMPDTGVIYFNGHNMTDLRKPAVALLRRSMGVVFQDFVLIPDVTVAANIGIPLEVAGVSRSVIKKRIDETLHQVGLPGMGNEVVNGLSGGEQQRVAIARALIAKPEIILADEPTGSLDAYNADYVLDLLEQASMDGATVVLATHDRMLMAARPHRVIALEQGRVTGISEAMPNRMTAGSNIGKTASAQQAT